MDALPVGGIARCLHLAVVDELYLVHPFRGVGGGQRLKVRAERLSPDVFRALVLKQICHFAALQLRLGDLIALRFAAGVEVVAVGESGAVAVIAEGVAVFAVGGVVRADVGKATLI